MKGKITRVIASLLAVVMTVTATPAIPAKAEESYEEKYLYDLEQMSEEILMNEDAEGYSNGAVTFPSSAVMINMGQELVYHLFRQGNTEKEQTVTIATQDISAGYDKNYEVVVDGEVIKGKSNILLDGKGIIYDVYLDSGTTTSEETEENSQDVDIDNVRENASSTFDITFMPGEQVKEIRIRAKVPTKAENHKELQLVIVDYADDLELGVYSCTSITLMETREFEDSQISLVEGSEEVIDGYLTFMVERTGNTSGYTSYDLAAEDGTAVNGEDYILNSTQLIFSPGVSKQRVHVPLVAASDEEEKTLTIAAGESEEVITYFTTREGTASKTFTKTRGLVDIPMEEFSKASYNSNIINADEFVFEKDGESYTFGFRSIVGSSNSRNASIRTNQQYDFSGVKAIRLSASYAPGTVAGDFLNVYASNEDYYANEAMLGKLDSNDYGGSMDVLDLTGRHIHEFKVDRDGDYYVYFTAEQHSGSGWIYYNLYNQDFGSDARGHVALVLNPYKLEAVNPSGLSGGVPAMDVNLTMTTDSSISGKNISEAYRGESYTISYNLADEDAIYSGYELVDAMGKVYYTEKTTAPVFNLTSEIIERYSHKFTDNTIRVRPIFQYAQAEVDIFAQDFQEQGMENLNAYIYKDEGKAVYTDNGTEIATITWDNKTFEMGSKVNFKVMNNPSYAGEYHFTAFKEEWGSSRTGTLSNAVYHGDDSWSLELEKNYYAITPIISNKNAKFLLKVSGASHGVFPDKPEGFTGDTYTVESFNGKYKANEVVTFDATPDAGYRAKWTYRDVATGEDKVYYGPVFYYRVQVPMLATDNHVQLEFEKCSTLQTYNVVADVYMQGGNILHEPEEDSEVYSPLTGSWVAIDSVTKQTDSDGSTNVMTINAAPGEIHTALVTANNRYYIQDVVVPVDSSVTNFRQTMKLSYYYEGPRVTSVHYYDYDSVPQSGDVIYLEDETESVIIGASIEKAGSDVTDVLFKIKDSNGDIKGNAYVGTRNNNEYIWSAQLGIMAAEGDEIWIELVKREYDGDTVVSEISYGEFNTGYSIVIAEFMNTSYIPDTGLYQDVESVPIFGTMYFLLGKWGMKPPTLTVSKTAGILYMTIGVNYGGMYNLMKDQNGERKGFGVLGSWNTFKQSTKTLTKVFGKKAGTNEAIAAKQMLKRHNLSFQVAISAQLALYDFVDTETKQSNLVCIGAFMTFGLSGSYTQTIPTIINGIPFFVSFSIAGSFADTVEIYSKDVNGYIAIQMMHDRTHSAYKPNNDLKFTVSPGIMIGVGANGVLDVAAGGDGTFAFDWVDWSYGKGVLNLLVDVQLDLIIFGGKAQIPVDNYVLFNESPYLEEKASVASLEAETSLLDRKISTLSVKPLEQYSNQSVNNLLSNLKTSSVEGTDTLVSDAYEFTRPKLYHLGNGRYMILATVEKSFVDFAEKQTGGTEDGTEETSVETNTTESTDENSQKAAVLAYAIYNSTTGTYEEVGEDGKVFHSLLPESEVGNSIDFHPVVVEIGSTGKYVIFWNKILYNGNVENLSLVNVRTAIQAVVYDSTTGDYTHTDSYKYAALVAEDENKNIMSGIVLNATYDSAANEVVVLYRTMNQNNLTEDSKLIDYARVGSSLMVTSIKADNNGRYEFTESIPLVSGGVENGEATIIKTADLAMMDGRPYVTYNVTQGTQASLLNEAEDGSTNDIYLTQLSREASGGYAIAETKKVTEGTSELYNITPNLISGEVAGKTENILMWKQESRMATVNVSRFFDEEDYVGSGTAIIPNEAAGNMDDFQMIKGDNGKIYSIWTESADSGTGMKVMMSALETVERDTKTGGVTVVSWGQGSKVLETTDDIFVKAMSPKVDKDGNLYLLYRADNISTGYSEIVLCHQNVEIDKLTLENYIELSDAELAQMKDTEDLANLRLRISNLKPKAGEMITVTGRVANRGVTVTEAQELELYANGEPTGQTTIIEPLNSGEEREFEISYVMPQTFGKEVKEIQFTVAGKSSLRRGAGNIIGSLSETVISGPVLEISNISYEQLDYPDFTDENATVSFNIKADVTNVGNEPADNHYLTISRIEQGKDESGEDVYFEEVFGEAYVSEVEPEETITVEHTVAIPAKYFNENVFKLGSVAFALFGENEEGERYMVDGAEDYLQAQEAPQVTSLRLADNKTIGVGQTLNLKTKIEPASAQMLAGLKYSSSDTEIAVVDADGFITGVKEGQCSITVTTENGFTETIVVRVVKGNVSDDESEDPIVDPNKKPDDATENTNNNIPGKTGDSSNPILWIVLVGLSLSCMAGVLYWKKRRFIK